MRMRSPRKFPKEKTADMPGFEWIDQEEKEAVGRVFDEGGTLFAHGFDARRRHFHVR